MRVDEHTITLDQAPVFYRSAPAGDPPAVFLHGIPTSSDDWVALLQRTGGIAPDLIGFGRTAKGGHLDYTLAGLCDFVERLLDHLGIERVKLVGHDWGAAAGVMFAQRRPDRVERIVLVDPLPLMPGFDWHRLGRIWRRRATGELAMGSTTRWLLARELRSASAEPGIWSAERVSEVWQQFDQGTQRAILRLHRATGPEQLAAAGAGLSRLGVPGLIVWGDADPWFDARLAEPYAARFGTAPAVAHIPDAGHWPWLEQPRVAELIAAFLR